jgi:hypothetical protein
MLQWTVTTWRMGNDLVGRCHYLIKVFFGVQRPSVNLNTHVNLVPRAELSEATPLLRLYAIVTFTGQLNRLNFSSLHLLGVTLEHHEHP